MDTGGGAVSYERGTPVAAVGDVLMLQRLREIDAD